MEEMGNESKRNLFSFSQTHEDFNSGRKTKIEKIIMVVNIYDQEIKTPQKEKRRNTYSMEKGNTSTIKLERVEYFITLNIRKKG